MDLGLTRESFSPSEDQSWLGGAHGTNDAKPVTIDVTSALVALYEDVLPSGVVLVRDGSNDLFVPRALQVSNEQQTLTEGGSGLTSFTITFGGQTTASLDDDATTAQVQAALEALSTIGEGNVSVTGTTAPIAMTVTFQGDLADENVAAMTTTPTGGTGTVVVATSTAGGAESPASTAVGYLLTTKSLGAAGTRISGSLFWHGSVIVANLPVNSGYDSTVATDLPLIKHVA